MIKSILKSILIGIILYVFIGILLFQYIFNPLKKNVIEQHNSVMAAQIALFEEKIYEPLLNINYSKIKNLSEDFIAQNDIQTLNFKLLDYFISVDNLLTNSSNIKSKDWVIDDIAIDFKFGELHKISDTLYAYEKNDEYNFKIPIEVKFQALSEDKMENSISSINFVLPQFLIEEKKLKSNYQEQLKQYLKLTDLSYEKTFLLPRGNPFASLSFSYSQNKIVEKLYNILKNIFINYSIIFLILFLLYFVISYIFTYNYILKHLHNLQAYIDDIEKNKFYKYDPKILRHKKVIKIASSLALLSKKMASIINELNVNKDLLEQQVSLDAMTKLPNRKIFESDLKSLFITHVDSYIGKLKLLSLAELAILNNQDLIDNFIKEFARYIEQSFQKFSNNYGTIYRIYGSEFVFIVKHASFDQMSDILEDMDIELQELKDKYEIKNEIFKAVSIPLHKFTSIPKIYKDLDTLFEKHLHSKKSHYILDNELINQEDEKLEKTIQSIIKNDAFTIGTKFDTFNFEETPQLIMQEISPNLIDTEGKEIPIGTFIGVAEILNIAIEFDKNVILKTFKYIRKNNIQHELAINLSISSMCDEAFITWLETKILYEYQDILNKVVFSITSFAAKANFDKFVEFTNRLKRFNCHVILKRYSYNDLSMQELEQVNLKYIRIHKDYTNNIDHERETIIRNIINFANLQNTKILGDVITNKHDYESVKKLRFYGTSR